MIDTFAIRCNVLKLAFSGQLSQHEIGDGTIDDLLKRVDPNREIKQAEAGSYEIPEHWAWVKLEDLYEINPRVDANDDADAAFIPMERISAGFSDSFSFEVQKWCVASKNHTRFADGDVAFAKISPCFENRKSFIAAGLPNGIGGGTTELIILRQKEMLPRFTYYITLDQRFIHDGIASYKGTVGQQRVKSDVIKNYMVAVPPKEEQRRIVEKIEDIFSVLDTIDTLQSQYQDNLATLKSKLIDAGIQGKLTEQLPEDGTAEELYQQIQQEKQNLIDKGLIKKEKPFSTSPVFIQYPFDIPENWCFVRLGELMLNRDSERIPVSVAERRKREKTYDYYGASGVIDKIDDYLFDKDLLLIGEDGANLLARSSPIAFIASGKYWVNNHAHVLDVCEGIELKYICYYINAISLAKYVTGSAQPKMNQENMNAIWIALPPLAEQKRIVAKLEELLPLCES